jgi:hypothetical protein
MSKKPRILLVEATEVIRKHLFAADTVMQADHNRIIVMAAVELLAVGAIKRRLRQALAEWLGAADKAEATASCFGCAIYPEQGSGPVELVEAATRELIEMIGADHV